MGSFTSVGKLQGVKGPIWINLGITQEYVPFVQTLQQTLRQGQKERIFFRVWHYYTVDLSSAGWQSRCFVFSSNCYYLYAALPLSLVRFQVLLAWY